MIERWARLRLVVTLVGAFLLLALLQVRMAWSAEVAPSCPFKIQPNALGNIYTNGNQRIVDWRGALKQATDPLPIRAAMADYAINLMLRANALDAAGDETQALRLRKFVRSKLPDTDWRIQFLSRQGDLGAIEARIGWLRSEAKPPAKEICELASRGAQKGGAESLYRLALCVTSKEVALQRMNAAASRGHAAAMEAIGRLCLSGQVKEGCSFARLCLAAQAGRIGAAGTVGWHLTGQHQHPSMDGAAWLKRAADAGDAIAQNNLGEWHERDLADVGGREIALQWYRRAAASGLPAAMVNAARLLASKGASECEEARAYLVAAAQKGLAQAGEWAQMLTCE
jgi:TPR repeat protein